MTGALNVIIWVWIAFLSFFLKVNLRKKRLRAAYARTNLYQLLASIVLPAGLLFVLRGTYLKITGQSWTAAEFAVLLLFISISLAHETVLLIKAGAETDSYTRNLAIAKEHAEIESLKVQLDSHFLFNSLNTLNYLISPGDTAARGFVSKLADVYRYILVNKSSQLVTVQEELRFATDYFQLLKERFGDAVTLRIEITDIASENALLPPISLQTLIENAIKHNSFSDGRGLNISIYIDALNIKVTNNVNRIAGRREGSLGVGLRNLRERFQISMGKRIQVRNFQDAFTVTLPIKRI